MAFDTSQFAIFTMFNTAASNQEFWSNNYNFDDEEWVRRARIVYKAKVADGASPGNLVIYDQEGIITETADSGLYSLINSKGFASAVKDIDNINVRVKELTFGLLLNDITGPAIDGSVTTSNSASGSSLTYSHSVGAGLVSPVVLIMVQSAQATNATGTMNGVALNSHVFTTGNFYSTLLWGTPIEGSNSITLNWAISSSNIGISTVTVKNAGTPTGFALQSTDTQFPTIALTSTIARSLFFEFFMTTSGITVTTSAGQTQLANFSTTGSSLPYNSSYKRGEYPGSTAMTVGMSTNAALQLNGFVVPPATAPINPGIQRVIFYGDLANLKGSSGN